MKAYNPEPYENCWFCQGNLENCPYHNEKTPNGRRDIQKDTTSMEETRKKVLDHVDKMLKSTEEPQIESWEEQFDETFWALFRDNENQPFIGDKRLTQARYGLKDVKSFISSLLSKTRQEERQRVVRIAEEMKRVDNDPYHEASDEIAAYNEGLTDLSSRVLEDNQTQ